MKISITGLKDPYGPIDAEAEIGYDVVKGSFTAVLQINVPTSWTTETLTFSASGYNIETPITSVSIMAKAKLDQVRQAYNEQNLPNTWGGVDRG